MNRWGRILSVAAFGAATGYGLSLTSLPMPWLIGPMIVAAAHAVAAAQLSLPGFVRPAGQIIVACVVGLAFTQTAFHAFIDHLAVMVLVAIATIFASFAAAFVLVRLSSIDPISATISSVPGGPVEMSAFAETYNVAPAPIALVQTLRITLLVLTIPPALVLTSGVVPDARTALSAADFDLAGSVLLLCLATAGAFAFKLFRLTSPYFLGALAVSATTTVLMLPVSAPPYWLLCAAQVLLGITLGNMFDRSLLIGMRRFVMSACASTLVLVVLTLAIALAVSAFSDIPAHTMVLATAPGGVTEMALTARILHQDPALVTAFHLVRIFTIIPFAPLVFAGAARAARRFGQVGAPDTPDKNCSKEKSP
ncbi:AbrB family transcriptional regulator [Puniceibacterium sp. IMCC21224]|uniref:AbrB family transcriptional regulator n=1 Tax=Puniceibacterium sp. IMCC21224 TaxID=1618204 RepID=UPI00064E0306|nr:AbrB family transcriptional regulator [Puniceibacterium sp. IMCC21224]KMK64941.1 membrane protein AbrB duplication [Puniceibacterium sp. IMCC21224]